MKLQLQSSMVLCFHSRLLLLSRFILTAFFLVALVTPLLAQNQDQHQEYQNQKTYTLIFRGVSLQRALQKLVKATHIDLVYDPKIMPDRTVFATARKERPEAILRDILQGSHLDFVQLSSGTYVLTPAPQKPVRFGSISGQVIDKSTGTPLAGANVMLADASGGAATNDNGYFIIPKLNPGYHRITITYLGYSPVADTVWVPSSATASLNFSLPPRPVFVEPIYVEGIQKRRPASQPLSNTIDPSRITIPQIEGNADAVKSLSAVSGIDFSLPSANFHIQGGSAGTQKVRLDGVPIYNPVSMGQLLGAFNPWAIKKIIVHKAGFAAPVGSQLSGVVNMIQEAGDSTEAPFLLEANPLNINGRFTQQFNQNNGHEIRLMLAGRANIWRWYQQPKMKGMLQNWNHLDPLLTLHLLRGDSANTFFKAEDHSYDVSYYDLHAVAEIHHNKFSKTKISAYFGKNILNTDLFSGKVTLPNAALDSQTPNLFYSFDHYNWTNYMTKAEHSWLINARLNASVSGYFTHHSFNHHYILTNNRQVHTGDFSNVFFAQTILRQYAFRTVKTGDKNAINQSSARFTLKYQAAKNYTLSGGAKITHLNYKFSLSDLYYNATRTDASSFLISGYVQNDFLLSPKLSFSAGSRITFIPSRDLVFAEPRLAFKFDDPATPVGYFSARLAGGIYRQFINEFDITNVGPSALVPTIKFWVPVDYTTTVPKAYHVAFESLIQPANGWKIRVESYYKWIPSRLVLDYAQLSAFPTFQAAMAYSSQHQFITTAQGYAYGAGLSVNKLIYPLNLELASSYQYSISRERLPSRFGGNYEPLPFSQPHKASVSARWKIIPEITLLLRWEGIWGRSWGFRKAYYDYLSIRESHPFGNYSFTDPGNDRLPRFSRLNASLSYRLEMGRSTLQFRFDAFNIFNHENVLNWWLMPFNNNDGTFSYHRRTRTMSGFRPSLSIKLSY